MEPSTRRRPSPRCATSWGSRARWARSAPAPTTPWPSRSTPPSSARPSPAHPAGTAPLRPAARCSPGSPATTTAAGTPPAASSAPLPTRRATPPLRCRKPRRHKSRVQDQGARPLGDLQIGEATRRRRHDAVIEVVAADAAETTRALADATVGLGGIGVPGDGLRVMAHLAAVLPGWGDGELAALGRRTALDLAGRSAEEVAAALRARGPLLGGASFAAG